MTQDRDRSPSAVGLGLLAAGLAAIVLVCTHVVGACGLFALMVALNGFSESEAAPIFVGYLGLLVLASAALVGVVDLLVLRRRAPSGTALAVSATVAAAVVVLEGGGLAVLVLMLTA
jgi:hypothetical protein